MIRSLTRNWSWKLLSVLAASLYWLAVASEPRVEMVLQSPVQLKDAPRDLEISSELSHAVRLEVSGVGGRLQEFSLAPPAVVLDLSGVHGPGERTFNIDSKTVRLPRGIQLLYAVPAQLRFVFERQVQRSIPVDVRFIGEPSGQRHVSRTETNPPSLVVVGPESKVRLVRSILTDPVNLASLDGDGEVVTHPYITDPQVRFLNFQRIHVKVILKN